MFELTLEAEGLDAVKRMLNGIPGAAKRATVRALNDTAKTIRAELSKVVREKVNIKKKDIDPHFKIKLARQTTAPSAAIVIKKSRRLSLKYFGARQTKSGVTYKISKTGGRSRISDAFIVQRLGGHVFRRDGKKRLPVSKVLAISAWGVVAINKLDLQAVKDGQAILRKNLLRQVNYELLKARGEVK